MDSDHQFFSRVAEVLAEEQQCPQHWWYLSFADSEFRGAFVVRGQGAATALIAVNATGQNPGGEVLCVPIPDDKIPAEEFRDRLLTKPEIERMWAEPCKTLREWDEEDKQCST